MSLKGVTAYWKHWVSKDQKEDPFAFLSADGDDDQRKVDGDDDQRKDDGDDDQGKDDGDEDKGSAGAGEKQQDPPHHFNIDDDIPYPLQCNTSDERTLCLQKLVPNGSQTNKMFHSLVEKVDSLGVSCIPGI